MPSPLRLEATLLVTAVLATWSYGLKIDFSRLSLPSRSFLHTQKRSSCQGNPCDPATPFLCQSSPQCIKLNDICDGKVDCDDGFDESPAVCYGASRPSMEAIYEFVQKEAKWMVPALFNGADPEMVAHTLTLASGVGELQDQLGLTQDNLDNIHKAIEGVLDGDERPLRAMGMPERAWPEVKFLFEALVNSGFDY